MSAESTTKSSDADAPGGANPSVNANAVRVRTIPEQIVEIVSDSGEGAQTAGQLFGTVCAKMGNGLWTVEIIPAEIEPPARSQAGASGIRIRFATRPMTNMGDQADLVVSFNEQVLYSRIDQNALRSGTVLLIDDRWAADEDPAIQEAYQKALDDFRGRGYEVREIPIHSETSKVTDNPQRGKNMWVVGLLCALYNRDLGIAKEEVAQIFQRKRKGQAVIDMNHKLLDAGHAWAIEHLDERFDVPSEEQDTAMVVMNGNAAVAMGAMAAGIEVCSMYPITPATSATHYLASVFHEAGGVIHQAEDEIAATGFAIGASYAGKTAITITSGPGMALKTEMLALAVMAEIPLVVVDVQRGGPSTGLPTKVEQGDLLSSMFGMPGDAPKVVMAASSIEECFHFIITARKLAEAFCTPVIVLTDANLATGQTSFPRPEPSEDWLSPPVDQSPWEEGVAPYAWDQETGLSRRPVPGQAGGAFVLTGLAHDEKSHIAYESAINQRVDEDAQPQDGRAPEDAQAAGGPRRPRGRPAGGGLGLDARCHRRGGRSHPQGRAQGRLLVSALPVAAGARTEGDLRPLQARHDRRDQLQRRPRRPADRRRNPALLPAGVAAPRPHPGRRRLLVPRAGSAPSPWDDRRGRPRPP